MIPKTFEDRRDLYERLLRMTPRERLEKFDGTESMHGDEEFEGSERLPVRSPELEKPEDNGGLKYF